MRTHDKNNRISVDNNESVTEQAFHWVTTIENDDCTHSERKDFVRWIKASPKHISEFIEMSNSWEQLDQIKNLDCADINAMVDQQETSENIVPLVPGASAQHRENPPTTTAPSPSQTLFQWFTVKTRHHFAIAASLLAVVSLAFVLSNTAPDSSVYTTMIGEQRSWTLNDGSVLHLNTHSQLKISYSDSRRLIELQRGEALFDVAHDPDRPFYVKTDDALVRAVGTSFNVYRNQHREVETVVTVVEGKVAIASTMPELDLDTEQEQELKISAGNQLTVKSSGEMIKNTTAKDIIAATAWRQRKLVFSSTPLNSVVNEFNRYNKQKIIITSKTAGNRDISGVFNANKPGDLLVFLENDKSIEVITLYDQVIISDTLH